MFKTVLLSGLLESKAVATIETLIFPFMFSSLIAPNINSGSESISAVIFLIISSTSKKLDLSSSNIN